jgi:hypothetical protein
MWWREATLEEQLDAVLNKESREWENLFTPPQREPAENYALGRLLLRRHGLKLQPHPKGKWCLHWVEGLPEDAEAATAALMKAFRGADEQLTEFWRPMWEHRAAGPLRQHTRWMLRREESVTGNKRFCSELELLRKEVAELRQQLKDAKSEKPRCSCHQGKTYGEPKT